MFLRILYSAIFYMSGSWACLISIAIWNKNKVVVGLAAFVWVANGSFLVYGMSLSTDHADELKRHKTWLITRLHSGEESISKYLNVRTYLSAGPLFMGSE